MAEGKFREDLFYRVASARLTLPPLRERTGDIKYLADKIMDELNEELSDDNTPKKSLTPKAYNVIKNHIWPGNYRELKGSLTSAWVWSLDKKIKEEDMAASISYLVSDGRI